MNKLEQEIYSYLEDNLPCGSTNEDIEKFSKELAIIALELAEKAYYKGKNDEHFEFSTQEDSGGFDQFKQEVL